MEEQLVEWVNTSIVWKTAFSDSAYMMGAILHVLRILFLPRVVIRAGERNIEPDIDAHRNA